MSNSKGLTVVERAKVAIGASEREKELRELVTHSTHITEIKNAAGREQCHGAAMALRTQRTGIRKIGKEARDDATKFSKAVINREDELVAIIEPEEQRLIALRDAWDEAREVEKRAKVEAEQRRIAAIRAKIAEIERRPAQMIGKTSVEIEAALVALEGEPITVNGFAELTGEAEQTRGLSAQCMAELRDRMRAQEIEAQRLAEERAKFERAQAAAAERARHEAAARAEQERKDAEARATREAAERAQREAEDAARREREAREDAERRAAIKAEEQRLAAERAEVARRQAELDRADRERREREATALREMEEASARIERERVERESAENLAARLAAGHTGGRWSVGRGCIVTDEPIPGNVAGRDDVKYYGGHLIAESIFRPADAHLIAAAPALLRIAQAISDLNYDSRISLPMDVCADLDRAIEAATCAKPDSNVVRIGKEKIVA